MLFIPGLVGIFPSTIQVYKTAIGIGRNADGWAVLTPAVGILLQFVLPFFRPSIGLY